VKGAARDGRIPERQEVDFTIEVPEDSSVYRSDRKRQMDIR
jgi:hypothetical protein